MTSTQEFRQARQRSLSNTDYPSFWSSLAGHGSPESPTTDTMTAETQRSENPWWDADPPPIDLSALIFFIPNQMDNIYMLMSFCFRMTSGIWIGWLLRPLVKSLCVFQKEKQERQAMIDLALSYLYYVSLWVYWVLSWIPGVGIAGRWISGISAGEAPRLRRLFRKLSRCESWEEYQTTCYALDEGLGLLKWRNDKGGTYSADLITERLQKLREAWEKNQHQTVLSLVRSHTRNIGQISAPRLYRSAFSGTKFAIEEYVCEVARSIDRIVQSQREGVDFPDGKKHRMPIQNLLDFVFNTRQVIGRTALLFQGGATFGLMHIGVARALRRHGLLPRIIVGESTGALIAALLCTKRETELPGILDGTAINLDAFLANQMNPDKTSKGPLWSILSTVLRRLFRYWDQGNVLDIATVEECVKANLGDITFEEAYQKTKRILNIIIYQEGGEPLLLNYLNAPQVLIWTAAVVSSTSANPLFGKPTTILCRSTTGEIMPWADTYPACLSKGTSRHQPLRNEVLHRVRSQFQVNHFIISQARPSLSPFLQSELHTPNHYWMSSLMKGIAGLITGLYLGEIAHYVRQANRLGIIPKRLAKYIVAEKISGSVCNIVPDLNPWDLLHVLDNPTPEKIKKWARVGERAAWPVIQALRVRCVVEVEVDRSYHCVRTLAGRSMGLSRISSWARLPSMGRMHPVTTSPMTSRPQFARHNSDPVPESSLTMTAARSRGGRGTGRSPGGEEESRVSRPRQATQERQPSSDGAQISSAAPYTQVPPPGSENDDTVGSMREGGLAEDEVEDP